MGPWRSIGKLVINRLDDGRYVILELSHKPVTMVPLLLAFLVILTLVGVSFLGVWLAV